MNLRTWQQNHGLLKASRDLLDKNDTFQQIITVAREESPANQPTIIGNTEPEHSRRLGFIEGYHHCLRVLEATWTKPIKPKELEATFEQPKE
jgi:hypothetical protein